jgi:hypothetical protein
MALTRGDKMIIIGAVVLAASVVMGLALLKKPRLFTGTSVPHTEAVTPVAVPPPPRAAAPVADAPASPPVATAVTIAPPPTSASPPAPAPSPSAPAPGAPQVAASAARPAVAGDETLEHMFAEIAKDDTAAAKAAGPKAPGPKALPGAKAAGPGPGQDVVAAPPGSTPVVVAEPQPASAPAPAPAVAEPKAAPAPTPAKAPAKAGAKTAAKAKAAAKDDAKAKSKAEASAAVAKAKTPAASGEVIRIVAQEKNGEYVLVVQTNRPPVHFQKMFVADPPRMVLDLPGSWIYSGPVSRTTGEGFIRQIRVGRHADMFRVVLDMAPDALSKLRGTPTVERVPEGVALRILK